MAITQRLFETLRYALANDSGLTTPASSATTTTGTATSGTTALTLTSTTSFSAGHGVTVANAGVGGGDMVTWITAINGSVATLHDTVITTITTQTISHNDSFCVLPKFIVPVTGNKPAGYPAIDLRLEVWEEYDFRDSTKGEFHAYIYVQSEPGGIGQPLTRLNMIADRIHALYHRQEESISNAAIRMQGLVEVHKTGIIPEIDISETTHSQHLRYEVLANLA